MKNRAIFLDRDGTIIIDKHYLNDPEGVEFLPNAREGLLAFQKAGYKLILVTNQSGVARGLVQLENLDQIHERLTQLLQAAGVTLDGIYVSPHAADSDHPTRKPNPGMLEQAAREHNIDLASSWMIGDKWIDVEAGHRAGTRSLFICGHADQTQGSNRPPELIASDLRGAAEKILAQ